MKNQGELFTQALSEVLEKQKQNNTARRRRYNSEHKPHQSQTIRSDKSQVGSAAITRPHTPLTLALTKHREYFSPYKVSHTDQNGNVIRFADIKTKGYPFEIK